MTGKGMLVSDHSGTRVCLIFDVCALDDWF